jgi:hypothetical protein
MAALEREIVSIAIPANADLSASQFRIAVVNSSEKAAIAAAATAKIIGVLYNKPAAADVAAQIAISGVARVTAGGVVAAGDLLTSDADGKAIATTTTGNVLIGRALTAGADTQLIEVLLFPGTVL